MSLSTFFSLNPFIRSFHDLTHPKSEWIFDACLAPENYKLIEVGQIVRAMPLLLIK